MRAIALSLLLVLSGCAAAQPLMPATVERAAAASISGKISLVPGMDMTTVGVSALPDSAALGSTPFSGSVDATGHFVVPVPASGGYTVVLKAQGKPLSAMRHILDTTVSLDVDLSPTGSVKGTLAGGAGAIVYVPGTSFMAIAADDGKFTLTDVPAGTGVTLKVGGSGFVPATLGTVDVPGGDTADFGTAEVTPASTPAAPIPMAYSASDFSDLTYGNELSLANYSNGAYVTLRNGDDGVVVSGSMLVDCGLYSLSYPALAKMDVEVDALDSGGQPISGTRHDIPVSYLVNQEGGHDLAIPVNVVLPRATTGGGPYTISVKLTNTSSDVTMEGTKADFEGSCVAYPPAPVNPLL